MSDRRGWNFMHGKNEAGQTFEEEEAAKQSRESTGIKIIDRRGQPKPERQKMPPDLVTEVRSTDDPLVFVVVLPGNRIPEHRVKFTRQEALGFNLAARRAKGLGPSQQKAVHAARLKVLKVVQKAMQVHEATGAPGDGGVH